MGGCGEQGAACYYELPDANLTLIAGIMKPGNTCVGEFFFRVGVNVMIKECPEGTTAGRSAILKLNHI